MKTSMIKILTALCTVTAVGSALADAGYTPPATGFVSTRTRAEVIDELKEARANGLTVVSMHDGQDENMAARHSMRTREEARAELKDRKVSDQTAFQKSLYFGG